MTLTGTKKHINKSKGIYSATQNLARTLLRIGFLVFDAPPPKANDDPATLLTDAAADSRMPTVPSPWFNHYGSSCSLRQAQAFHKRSKAIGLSCSDFGMWDSHGFTHGCHKATGDGSWVYHVEMASSTPKEDTERGRSEVTSQQ